MPRTPKRKPAKRKAKAKIAAPPAAPPSPPNPDPSGYEAHRDSMAAKRRRQSESGRDIGDIPPVADAKRKEACRHSLRLFCETYLADRFPLAWSKDHLDAIADLEAVALRGGQQAEAMPRGSGKTSLAEAAGLWALVYGHRRFLVLIAANEGKAGELLESLRVALETNDLLFEDFPEVCYPIRRLEGIANRCAGQTVNGERTRIVWTESEFVLPTVKGSAASGARVRVSGLTGSGIRGMKAATADGKTVRPDMVIVDDPQTDESAHSPSQNATRERLLNSAVLGMAGPKKKLACIVLMTVVAPGDLADITLDRDRNPQWHGRRTKLVYAFPTAEAEWEEYARIRADSLRAGNRGRESTEFYRERREIMDAGAIVAWPERFNDDEVSALQHAMNLRLDNLRAFQAEYQNDPLPPENLGGLEELSADEVAARLSRVSRGFVPRDCDRITAFIDVGQRLLYYVVCAWDQRFGGAVIDYGTYPRQNLPEFTSANARVTLADTFPGTSEEDAIYRGLGELTTYLAGREYPRQDGGAGGMRLDRCLIDSGNWSETVYKFVRQSPYASVLYPSKGFGITAGHLPMAEWKPRAGERRGWNWVLGFPESGKGRLVKFDANAWKSFAAGRLRIGMGAPSAVSIFGTDPGAHRFFADQLTSEYRTLTQGRGRTVEEWDRRPARENHWWDCFVGCAVAAGVQGLTFNAGGEPEAKKPARTVNLRDLYDAARKPNAPPQTPPREFP